MAVFREMLRAKIHGATITGKDLYYGGSIGIDKSLLDAGGIVPGEKVQVLNFSNGRRFETYVIEEGNGKVALYGPAARCGEIGDKICVIAYALVEEKDLNGVQPKVVTVGEKNRIIQG